MADRILWRASTTQHYWNDCEFIRTFLTKALNLGLIGPVTWRKAGIKGKQEKFELDDPRALLENLPKPKRSEPPNAYLLFGGEKPHDWEVNLSISQIENGELANKNMAWLYFDRSWLAKPASSKKLQEAFVQVHEPDNTEYAFIDPYAHWQEMADTYYKTPVTNGTMFKGVYWANYLGPGHLDQFDPDKLRAIKAYFTRWVQGRGFFLVTYPRIEDVEKPSSAEHLYELTQQFQKALLSD